jgi:hypothetical protein
LLFTNEPILGQDKQDFLLLFLLPVVVLMCVELLEERAPVWQNLQRQPVAIQWSLYYLLILSILLLGIYDNNAFIYFQF